MQSPWSRLGCGAVLCPLSSLGHLPNRRPHAQLPSWACPEAGLWSYRWAFSHSLLPALRPLSPFSGLPPSAGKGVEVLTVPVQRALE